MTIYTIKKLDNIVIHSLTISGIITVIAMITIWILQTERYMVANAFYLILPVIIYFSVWAILIPISDIPLFIYKHKRKKEQRSLK